MELVTKVFPVLTRQPEPVLIMPVGDIQWSGQEHDVAMRMLARHIQWGVDHNAYFLGMGDYIDMLSPSNRQRLESAALYDTAMAILDQKAEALVDEVYDKALAPSKGRWLGLLEGHHFHKYRSGITTDQQLADKLGAPFLGSSAYVRLAFRGQKRIGDVLIWCHHGVGAGQTAAGVLNKLAKVSQGFEADIYLMGHLHRKVAEPIDYTIPIFPAKGGGAPRLIHRTRIMACTGSFLKGYIPGSRAGLIPRGTYVEQKMLNPVALGGIVLTVMPRWVDSGNHGRGGTLWLPDLGVSQ